MISQAPKAGIYYNFARNYCKANRLDRSMEFLIKAFNTGISPVEKLEQDRFFDNLREDNRFKALVQSAQLVMSALELEQSAPRRMAELLEKSVTLCPEYSYPYYLLARYYARGNEYERALHCLGKSIEGGFSNFCDLIADPLFEKMRVDPEFQRLLKLQGAPKKQEA